MLLRCVPERIELLKSSTVLVLVLVHVHVRSSAQVLHITASVRKQTDANK